MFRKMKYLSLLFLGIKTAWAENVSSVSDASVNLTSAPSNSVGTTIGNAALLSGPLYTFLVYGCILLGLCFITWAIFDLIRKGDLQERVAWPEIILKSFAGAIFLSISSLCNEGTQTLFGQNIYIGSITGHPPGAVSNCNSVSVNGVSDSINKNGLICVLKNVGSNVTPILNESLFDLSSIVGTIIIIVAVKKMATLYRPNTRDTSGQIIGSLIVGICFTALPYLTVIMQNTLGIDKGFITTEGQTYTGSANVPDMFRYIPAKEAGDAGMAFGEIITLSFYIFTSVGLISILRAGIIFYRISTGNKAQNDKISTAIVHLVFGTLLANGKWSTCFIMSTLFGGGMGFCGE